MPAATLMLMGTSSSVGKSLLTAALCRIFARRGLRVAPFKAQNMSNNAAVCANGDEIGRAQAVQARAARVEPCADLNPVLLKPEGHTRSQVIVLGRPWQTLQASRYYERKAALWSVVTGALERLRQAHDLVVIEGAGSPVELNLKDSDIVNMAIARHAQSPVLLVGDIDKGGIFAQMLGTLWLLPPEERALVRGLIVNKFRGDPALFADGLKILEERGGAPVLGVVPYLADHAIPEEDAVALDVLPAVSKGELDIAIVRLPHIANFDDFDPLAREPGVRVRYVQEAAEMVRPDAVIVPGTKSTMADLDWMRQRGLDVSIHRLAGEGAAVVGICGGFQILGRSIQDLDRVESDVSETAGLGLLPVETSFAGEKLTRQVSAQVIGGAGWFEKIRGESLTGYEIHMGRTLGGTPWLSIGSAVSPDGRLWGCYLHGLFANDGFRRGWLSSLLRRDLPGPATTWDLDTALDRLADSVQAALDIQRIEAMLTVQ
jgi:adenosylcobyric acid synthase